MCAIEMYLIRRGGSDQPRFSMNQTVLSISSAAKVKYLKEVEFVRVGYDREKMLLILYPAGKQSEDSLKIQGAKGRLQNSHISSSGFCSQFGIENWQGFYLDMVSAAKTEIRLKKGDRIPHRGKIKTPALPDSKPDLDRGKKELKKPLIDYQCKACGYHQPAWKYAASMKPHGGHPKICPKCECTVFVPMKSEL